MELVDITIARPKAVERQTQKEQTARVGRSALQCNHVRAAHI